LVYASKHPFSSIRKLAGILQARRPKSTDYIDYTKLTVSLQEKSVPSSISIV
jgi:hypothetical protein